MYQTFGELNNEESYDTAIDYLQKRFDWNFEDKNVIDFLVVLKKKFSWFDFQLLLLFEKPNII